MKPRLRWTSLFALLLASCTTEVPFARVSYETRFDMATCGNVLNQNIYQPDIGPEGFASYRSYFVKGFSLKLHRDFTCEFTYEVKNDAAVSWNGTYKSATTNGGILAVSFKQASFDLPWVNYYQMKLEWDIKHPESGETLHAVALMHSAHIFTT